MKHNHSQFIENYIKKYESKLTRDQVVELLSNNENSDKDIPESSGQRLYINYLYFDGVKPENNETFEFSQEFQKGVNIIIADNLKGKSTVLKIIKWCLTGGKIKNINKWFHNILLNFNVNNRDYTVIIDNLPYYVKTKLYRGVISKIEDAENSFESVFIADGESESEHKFQEFFFNELNYYSLKWTQKHSKKNSTELLEANMSWRSYYSSIFLESKDSMSLYGKQETKIFEMLMGLQLTSILNNVKIKKELLENKKAQSNARESRIIDNPIDYESELNCIRNEYHEYKNTIINNKVVNTKDLSKAYNELSSRYVAESARLSSSNRLLHRNTDEKNMIIERLELITRNIKEIENRYIKTQKHIDQLKEYIDSKIFFSSLEIN